MTKQKFIQKKLNNVSGGTNPIKQSKGKITEFKFLSKSGAGEIYELTIVCGDKTYKIKHTFWEVYPPVTGTEVTVFFRHSGTAYLLDGLSFK